MKGMCKALVVALIVLTMVACEPNVDVRRYAGTEPTHVYGYGQGGGWDNTTGGGYGQGGGYDNTVGGESW